MPAVCYVGNRCSIVILSLFTGVQKTRWESLTVFLTQNTRCFPRTFLEARGRASPACKCFVTDCSREKQPACPWVGQASRSVCVLVLEWDNFHTSSARALPSRLRGRASPSALSAGAVSTGVLQSRGCSQLWFGCSQLTGEQKPLYCCRFCPAQEPFPACVAVRWLTEGVKVLGAPQFKAWILSALLKRTGLARRLGLLLLWRLVPWLSETLGLSSLLYPWPLLRCPGERGAYLGCYRLQPSSHPPSQETLGNGGSDKLVLVVNRICFARHFTL